MGIHVLVVNIVWMFPLVILEPVGTAVDDTVIAESHECKVHEHS
jgi:hypothetical protein